MSFNIPDPITYLMAWAATITGIWFLFEKTDETLSDQSRLSIGLWLKRATKNKTILNWPAHFIEIFDKVFDRDPKSFRRIRNSCIASTIFSLIMFFVWRSYRPIQNRGTSLNS